MKNEEASKKATEILLKIARKHFTNDGYFNVSLEKIAEEANVTRGAVYHHFKNKKGLFLAVLEEVQKDISIQIEKEALLSDEPWQQLILGCLGFIKTANTKNCRQILLIDAPAVIGWEAWRKVDQENSMYALQSHIYDLHNQNYLKENVDINLMTYAISGALNELALNYSLSKTIGIDTIIINTITQIVAGFKRESFN